MARNTNKAFEPFTALPPGVCPRCHYAMMGHVMNTATYFRMDEDGIDTLPHGSGDEFVDDIFVCMACGFMSTDYVSTDKGWRFNPHDDAAYIRARNCVPAFHKISSILNRKNPFVKEGDEDGHPKVWKTSGSTL